MIAFEAVIFDMDGTLVDSERLYQIAIARAGNALGYDVTGETSARMVGRPGEYARQILQQEFGEDFPIRAFFDHCRATVLELSESGVPLKPGATELLIDLSNAGTKLAVATSTRRDHALARLSHAGLLSFFETVVARDDVTHGKPHPESYTRAAAGLGVLPATCLAVEDSPTGVQAAHAAGIRTIMVPDVLAPSDNDRARSFAVLSDLHAVLHLLARR